MFLIFFSRKEIIKYIINLFKSKLRQGENRKKVYNYTMSFFNIFPENSRKQNSNETTPYRTYVVVGAWGLAVEICLDVIMCLG